MQWKKFLTLILSRELWCFPPSLSGFFPKELGECDLLQGDNRTRLLTAPLSSIKRIFSFLFTYERVKERERQQHGGARRYIIHHTHTAAKWKRVVKYRITPPLTIDFIQRADVFSSLCRYISAGGTWLSKRTRILILHPGNIKFAKALAKTRVHNIML
jgi:hypothetical protein